MIHKSTNKWVEHVACFLFFKILFNSLYLLTNHLITLHSRADIHRKWSSKCSWSFSFQFIIEDTYRSQMAQHPVTCLMYNMFIYDVTWFLAQTFQERNALFDKHWNCLQNPLLTTCDSLSITGTSFVRSHTQSGCFPHSFLRFVTLCRAQSLQLIMWTHYQNVSSFSCLSVRKSVRKEHDLWIKTD